MGKGWIIVLFVIVLAVGGIAISMKPEGKREEKPPVEELEYTGLGVFPGNEIPVGESVTVEVGVRAPAPGTYEAVLKVNGEKKSQSVEFENAGETRIVTFTLVRGIGKYELSAGAISETIKVRERIPAEFEVLELSVPDRDVLVDRTAEITLKVKNAGEVEGTYEATLRVDEKEVWVSEPIGAKERKVIFCRLTPSDLQELLSDEEEKSVKVRLEAHAKTFHLRKPREPVLEPIALGVPSVGYVGKSMTITATVRNAGERENYLTIEVVIVGEKPLTYSRKKFKGGEEYTHHFTKSFDEEKEYTLKLGELSQKIRIVPEPNVRVTKLELPKVALIGGDVRVKADVKNFGASEEPYNFTLKVMKDGVKKKEIPKSGRLEPGETDTLDFSFGLTEKGVYSVEVGSEAGVIKVVGLKELYVPGDRLTFRFSMLTEIPQAGIRETSEGQFNHVYQGLKEVGGYECAWWKRVAEGGTWTDFYFPITDTEMYMLRIEDYQNHALDSEVWTEDRVKMLVYPLEVGAEVSSGPVPVHIRNYSKDLTVDGDQTLSSRVESAENFSCPAGIFYGYKVRMDVRVEGTCTFRGKSSSMVSLTTITRAVGPQGTLWERSTTTSQARYLGQDVTIYSSEEIELMDFSTTNFP